MAASEFCISMSALVNSNNNNNNNNNNHHHCRCTRRLVDRRGSSGEGASWEASQRHPQEDAEGMPIRHTEHCTYF